MYLIFILHKICSNIRGSYILIERRERRVSQFTYRTSIVIYLFMIAFFPMITLGYYSYHTYVQQVTQKINMSTKLAATQIKGRVDSILVSVRKNYMEAVEEEAINWMLNHDISYSDYSYLVEASSVLQGNKYLMDYISGYTIINFDTEWVLSNRGMFKYELLTNKEEVEELKEYNKETLNRYFWLDRTNKSSKDKLKRETVNLQGLSLVLQVPMVKKEPHGLVIININQDKLSRVIEESGIETDITILNKDGTVIYSDNKEVAQYCSSHIEEFIDEERYSIQNKDKNKYILATSTSDAINWIYVASSNLNIVRESASGIICLMSLLSGSICVLLVCIRFFTNRIYNPILSLTQYVRKAVVNEQTGENEFEYLATSIDKLIDKKNFLEGLITDQQTQLTELFQLRLIDGDIRGEQVESYMQQLNIPRKSFYMIMSINLETAEMVESYDGTKQGAIQDAMRINVVEKLPDNITRELLMHPVYNYRAISVVIGDDEIKSLEDKVLQVFYELEKYVHEQYNLFISCGISTTFEALIDYRKAYNQSIEALKNQGILHKHRLDQQSDLIFYTDIKQEQEYIYDVVLEKQIKEAVDCGEEQEAFRLVDSFVDTLIKYRLAQNDCQLYLHRLLIAILNVMSDAGLSTIKLLKQEENNIFINFNQIYDVHKLKSFYKQQIITPIIQELSIYRASKSGTILETVRELVKERNGDITLTECAEQLHYHPTYIWKVMKLEGEVTFSDFIAEYKLGEAKRLLEDTDMTIAEIAQQLNYTNTQNFIRFFSKQEGVTPGKYRKNKKV